MNLHIRHYITHFSKTLLMMFPRSETKIPDHKFDFEARRAFSEYQSSELCIFKLILQSTFTRLSDNQTQLNPVPCVYRLLFPAISYPYMVLIC